jgi:hypothetical protein
VAEDRRKLLAYARDLLNSDYAGHRLTFQLFAQSPPFAHLLAVYRNFDFSEPMRIVRESAGLSERVEGDRGVGEQGDRANGRERLADASPTDQSPYPPTPLSSSVTS